MPHDLYRQPTESNHLLLLLQQLQEDYTSIPGIKAVKGKKRTFRVRVGRYRLIFEVRKNKTIEIRRLSKRNETTYKKL